MVTFTTGDGREVPAVSAEEMRQVDRIAVEDVGLSILQMMENAGRALASVVRETRPDDADGPVVVLAGGGGNGGGGLCAARHLDDHGTAADVVLDRDPDTLEGAAATQRRILRATDVRVDDETAGLGDPSLVVDALVGYGLRGPPTGRAETLVQAANRTEAPVVSLDVPTGVDATTGERPGASVRADRTVTLALPKTGLADASDLLLADIGLPRGVFASLGVDYRQPFDGRQWVSLRAGER